MSDAGLWLLRVAVGGGVVLLFGWLLMRRVASPAARQRCGEAAVVAGLLLAFLALGPAWLRVPLVGSPGSPESAVASIEAPPHGLPGAQVSNLVVDLQEQEPAAAEGPRPAASAGFAWGWWATVEAWVLIGYLSVAGLLVLRWLVAAAWLAWALRGARPAPPRAAALFDRLREGRGWRLVVSDRARVPFSVGVVWPAVVLPARLAQTGELHELTWVLRHELTHLRRQDTRTCWLLALGHAVFFFLPWFWWVRREVCLARELVADDAAVGVAGLREDYAEYLLRWWAQGAPTAAMGVVGSGSDLYRRIAMLVVCEETGRCRMSRRWLVCAGAALMAVAVTGAGVTFQAARADEGDNKPAKNGDESRTAPKKAEAPLPGVLDLQKLLDGVGAGGGLGNREDAMKDLEEMQRAMAEHRKRMMEFIRNIKPGQPLPPLPAMPGGLPRMPAMPAMPAMPGGGGLGLGEAVRQQGSAQQARLGAELRKPSQTLADQLDLPRNQGMILAEVGPNSPAAKAGLKQHDVLLELGGKPVSSKAEDLDKLLSGIKASQEVEAVVLRKGKKETIKGLKLDQVKSAAAPGAGGGVGLGGGGLAGGVTQFSAMHRVNGTGVRVQGSVENGKVEVQEVTIQDARGTVNKYAADKVPAEYQATVKMMTEEVTRRARLRR